jgi:hypothetical protein
MKKIPFQNSTHKISCKERILTKAASDLVPRVALARPVLGWWASWLDFELIPWVGVINGGWRLVP